MTPTCTNRRFGGVLAMVGLALSWGTACSGPAAGALAADTAGGASATTSATSPTSGYYTEGVPAWFSVQGTLALEGGVIGKGSGLSLVVYDELGFEAPLCTEEWPIAEAEVLVPTEEELFHWWLLTPAALLNCPQLRALPDELYLGIGELHPELTPHLGDLGLDGADASLYGAYAAFPEAATATTVSRTGTATTSSTGPRDAEVYVFGVAGTEADRAGETAAVKRGPVPDGTYLVEAVFLFSLEDLGGR